MITSRIYSHLGGKEIMACRFSEIDKVIDGIIASVHAFRTKTSKEKTMRGKMLYSPPAMNKAFKSEFGRMGFGEVKLDYDLRTACDKKIRTHKQIDYNKGRVNVEVQLGKYAFMFYDMSKFQHFYNAGRIDVGVEIVPTYAMMRNMSSGVSYGEQLECDIVRLNRTFPSVPVKIMMIQADEV